MCDIWKGNHNLKKLQEDDIRGLLDSLKKFHTKQVVMSGGEALLNPDFFRFCEILKQQEIKITLLSTGLTIKKHAPALVQWVDDVIVSLDGDEKLHDTIRNIPGAFGRLREGIETLRMLNPQFRVSGRTVIQRYNFRKWPEIVQTAKEIGLDSISFLPADVSSSAFNREQLWSEDRQHEILLPETDLSDLRKIVDGLPERFSEEFRNRFIAESPEKLKKIYSYYAAFYGYNEFPYKKCNAPWVSAVIEADGNVRPCFFHPGYGNIKSGNLDSIINSSEAIRFRKNLDMDNNPICLKCVCYLNLKPATKI
jgi:MoaA/NifB/PqqE/SkfB family radical SAM enzyme